jgi:hypothetical protein
MTSTAKRAKTMRGASTIATRTGSKHDNDAAQWQQEEEATKKESQEVDQKNLKRNKLQLSRSNKRRN